jgi:micrococcal nuclease
MGRGMKFDPRRRRERSWRRPPRGGGRRVSLGRWLARLRPFGMLAALVWLWGTNTGMVEPIGLVATAPERVDERFTRCGPGRGHGCVIDGDTFKLGQRKIRIIGIDAPETHPPRCPAEAALGEAATARLQALLNEGPFDMVGSRADMTDRYGRELRTLTRGGRSIAAQLVEEGVVRRYLGYKMGWC